MFTLCELGLTNFLTVPLLIVTNYVVDIRGGNRRNNSLVRLDHLLT